MSTYVENSLVNNLCCFDWTAVLFAGAPLPADVTETDLDLFQRAQAKANEVSIYRISNYLQAAYK